MPPFAEYHDVQGLVRFGHGHLTEARYCLLRIKDADAARTWLSNAPVTSAVTSVPRPTTALQVALSAEGLRALGVPDDIVRGFAPEFVAGSSEANRARRLGDVGPNDPANWSWGTDERTPHLVVMLFAVAGGLDAWETDQLGGRGAAAFETIERLPTSNLDGVEPFGFTDGVSQPAVDWDRQVPPVVDQTRYGNVLALGDLLLGYPNEYGKYTLRPLVNETDDLAASLPAADDQPATRDVGRNGTYVVLRQLEQDVRGFWQAVHQQSAAIGVEPQRLAELMVGRRMDGEPLLPRSSQPIADLNDDPRNAALNQFTFGTDPEGERCPLGSHIRRANPRNADYPDGTNGVISRMIRRLGLGIKDERADMLASTRFHRILRRGREYGPGLSPEDALQPASPGDPPRGLQFICLNGNLARQFEFVQSAWLMSATFDGTRGERDPLLGHRGPSPNGMPADGFSLPSPEGLAQRMSRLPQFVTVRGSAYFFMPGLRSLGYLIRASARARARSG